MGAPPPGLHDSFSEQGLWWREGEEDVQVGGTLTFDPTDPQAVQTWFDQYEVFSPAIGLFFTITGEPHMFTNVRLLLAIQALEVFHRRTSAENVMPPDDFPAFAAGLVDAIPETATPRMKDKLKGVYRYLNEPSLNQRLKSIVDDLETAFGRAPPGFDKARSTQTGRHPQLLHSLFRRA